SGWHGRIGGMMWPATRRIMMRAYDIRPGAASESRSRLESELDWLDCKLSDCRSYLVGDRFSRVDVTLARLLAPLRGQRKDTTKTQCLMLLLPTLNAGVIGL